MASNDKDSKQGEQSGSKQSGNTSKRGFASMDPELQRQIAAEGGRAAHQKGTAHEFTSEEARRAGAMSHKNDPGRSSQSASSGSSARGSGGSKGGAADEEERDDQQGGQHEPGAKGGGRGAGARSKS